PFASIVPRRPHRPTRLGVQQKKPHSRPGTEGDSRGTTLVNPGPDGPEFPHCPLTVRVRHGLLDRLAPARRRSACSLRANFHRLHTEPASSHGVGSLAAPGGVLFSRIAFVAVDCMSRPSPGPDGAVSQLT